MAEAVPCGISVRCYICNEALPKGKGRSEPGRERERLTLEGQLVFVLAPSGERKPVEEPARHPEAPLTEELAALARVGRAGGLVGNAAERGCHRNRTIGASSKCSRTVALLADDAASERRQALVAYKASPQSELVARTLRDNRELQLNLI